LLVSGALVLSGLPYSCTSGLAGGHISDQQGIFSLILAAAVVWSIAPSNHQQGVSADKFPSIAKQIANIFCC